MVKSGYTPEQIISKLREVKILLSQGEMVATISKLRSSRDLLLKILPRIRI